VSSSGLPAAVFRDQGWVAFPKMLVLGKVGGMFGKRQKFRGLERTTPMWNQTPSPDAMANCPDVGAGLHLLTPCGGSDLLPGTTRHAKRPLARLPSKA